jgi:cell wall-associated NlpC family hydrolase
VSGLPRTATGRIVAAAVVLALAVGAALLVLPVLMMMGSAAFLTGDDSSEDSATCVPTAEAGGRSISLDTEQLTNAGTIIATGAKLQVPVRGLVIAVATALQESVLRNLDHGDRDSVGLFQQRAGWGSLQERTDPPTSASMFYAGGRAGQPGLLDIPDWRRMTLTEAAQAVQRSAFPNAYAKWEPLAQSLVQSVTGESVDVGCSDAVQASLPQNEVGAMLRVALAQQGDPYVWGATGPDAFDCSGLVVYSWRQAGYRLTVRTADQMYDISTPLREGEEKPGDLLFGAFSGSHAGSGNAGHVMIVVRPGVAVQAPETGRNVEITRYHADGVKWRLGRLPQSALRPLNPTTTA